MDWQSRSNGTKSIRLEFSTLPEITTTESGVGLELLTENYELMETGNQSYLSNGSDIDSYFGNKTYGEDNFTTFETLNISNLSTQSDDYGPYNDHEDLYEVPLSMIIFLSLLYGAISASALVGNTLVLWIVAVSRRMRTVTNMFIANLALADIIIGLFTIPFQFQAALLQRWNLPDFLCALCPFVQVLSVNVSVFTLSAIAVDRYRAVLYPLSAHVSKRKATWAILSIWAVCFLLALPTELDYKVTQIPHKGSTKPFCANLGLSVAFRIFYHQGTVVIQYFFPLIIISVAYIHMGFKLWGATAPGNKEESRDAVVLRNKKKVIKMLALVVLMFAVCWFPLQSYNFLQAIYPQINSYQYINVIWFASHSLAMSNSSVNPFIYAIYNDKFQREFQARLRCFRRCYGNGDDRNWSDGSEIDPSKIRAQYRFTNNRGVKANNGNSRYGYTNEIRNPRNLGNELRRSLQNYNECQRGQRYLMEMGTYSYDNPQLDSQHQENRHHYGRPRSSKSGSSSRSRRSSESSSSGNNNTSSGNYSTEFVPEFRRSNGISRYHLGSSVNFETEMVQQETSLTLSNNARVESIAVVSVSGKVAKNNRERK